MGIAAGGNINRAAQHVEPIGGSAQKYHRPGVINPLAAICAARLMLDFLGETTAAAAIETAVIKSRGKNIRAWRGKMGYATSQVGDLVAAGSGNPA